MSLSSILRNLPDSINQFALIFDGFQNATQQTVSYGSLKNSLVLLKANFFDVYSPVSGKLFAIYFQSWNKPFYQLLLSIIYSNNAYFVIDTKWPLNYIQSVLEQAKPNFILCECYPENSEEFSNYENIVDKSAQEVIRVQGNVVGLEVDFRMIKTKSQIEQINELVYVIATSGTTGKPKIISVCNSSIWPNIPELSGLFEISSNDTVYQASSLTFDPSLIELFATFHSRATLLVLPQLFKLMPNKLCDHLIKQRVSILQITPSLFKNISNHLKSNKYLKTLVLGGEAFPNKCEIIRELVKRGVKVLNIYGITELSCWSSCHRVTKTDLEDAMGIPIGNALNQTELFVALKETNSIQNVKALDQNKLYEGKLLHKSSTRLCLINGMREDLVDSGDVCHVFNGHVYIQGRTDRAVKINGKMVDLVYLENVSMEIAFVERSIADFDKTFGLVLFVLTKKTKRNNEPNKDELNNESKKLIQDHIKSQLPSQFEPNEIILLASHESLPINAHGKINIDKLKSKYLRAAKRLESHEEIESYVESLWKQTLGIAPDGSSNFILSGGNSLKALVFIDHIEDYLRTYYPNINEFVGNKLLDVLLNESFSSLKNLLITDQYDQLSHKNLEQTQNNSIKKIKLSDETHYSQISNSKHVDCIGKTQSNCDSTQSLIECSHIEIKWTYDTLKCVDATPLLLIDKEKRIQLAFIGSHSNKFVCLNAQTGQLCWLFEAQDRIESSACLSSCDNFVMFGSYDHFFYVLHVESGRLKWKYKTEDVIKSSPYCNASNSHVYFGCHDKHLYCLDIYKKELVWKVNLDSCSIFSSVVCDNADGLFISTLGGNLFKLKARTADIKWRFELDKAVFTTPVLNPICQLLFIGTCGATFYCLTSEKQLRWKFKTEKPIFSSACLIDDQLVCFGCHDFQFYCLNQSTGELVWKRNCNSEIYSNPFRIDSEKIICVSSDGVIFMFNATSGQVLLQADLFRLKNSCFSSPIVFEKRVYLGCRNNLFYCLQIN